MRRFRRRRIQATARSRSDPPKEDSRRARDARSLRLHVRRQARARAAAQLRQARAAEPRARAEDARRADVPQSARGAGVGLLLRDQRPPLRDLLHRPRQRGQVVADQRDPGPARARQDVVRAALDAQRHLLPVRHRRGARALRAEAPPQPPRQAARRRPAVHARRRARLRHRRHERQVARQRDPPHRLLLWAAPLGQHRLHVHRRAGRRDAHRRDLLRVDDQRARRLLDRADQVRRGAALARVLSDAPHLRAHHQLPEGRQVPQDLPLRAARVGADRRQHRLLARADRRDERRSSRRHAAKDFATKKRKQVGSCDSGRRGEIACRVKEPKRKS